MDYSKYRQLGKKIQKPQQGVTKGFVGAVSPTPPSKGTSSLANPLGSFLFLALNLNGVRHPSLRSVTPPGAYSALRLSSTTLRDQPSKLVDTKCRGELPRKLAKANDEGCLSQAVVGVPCDYQSLGRGPRGNAGLVSPSGWRGGQMTSASNKSLIIFRGL